MYTIFLNHHPYDLSGGEIQRAGFVKLLLLEPKILLLDEPTKGCDSFSKAELAKTLKELSDNQITILLVTHDLDFFRLKFPPYAQCFLTVLFQKDLNRTNFIAENDFIRLLQIKFHEV